MNSVELAGRLVRDPEGSGNVVTFILAVDRNGKDKGADFPRVVAFNKTAEIVSKYFKKGRLVEIQGRIMTGSYDGKNGTVYTTDVCANEVRVLDWNDQKSVKPEPEPKKVPEPESEPTQESFEALDEDVPF